MFRSAAWPAGWLLADQAGAVGQAELAAPGWAWLIAYFVVIRFWKGFKPNNLTIWLLGFRLVLKPNNLIT